MVCWCEFSWPDQCRSGGAFANSSTSLPGAGIWDGIGVGGEMVFGDWNRNGDSEVGLRVSFVSIRIDRRLGPALRGGDWGKSEDRGGIGASWESCGNVLGLEGSGSTV